MTVMICTDWPCWAFGQQSWSWAHSESMVFSFRSEADQQTHFEIDRLWRPRFHHSIFKKNKKKLVDAKTSEKNHPRSAYHKHSSSQKAPPYEASSSACVKCIARRPFLASEKDLQKANKVQRLTQLWPKRRLENGIRGVFRTLVI